MAKRKKLALLADAKLQKRMKKEAALQEEAVGKAKAVRKAEEASKAARDAAFEARNNKAAPDIVVDTGGGTPENVAKATSAVIVKNITSGTADIKEAVKEVIVNNSTESSRIVELLENNNKKLTKKQRKDNDAEIINSMQNDDMKVLAALLMQMRDKDDRKLTYTKVQVGFATFTSILALLIAVFVGIAVLSILPKIDDIIVQANNLIAQTNTTIVEANQAISQANDILNDVQPVVDNLNTVTNDLASADITGMLEDVDSLVVSSEKNMAEALQTITDIDIQSLNDAIADLSAIVAPLSSMFRR
ncbi:MAG: hypothetical protein IKP31_06450 [Lachnospiraceae bacterium]|nr:hypothetical protein [Lachnospiraceae bacterium]